MLFYDCKFLLFFFIIFIIYWFLKNNTSRKVLLLFSSYYFYTSWNKELLVLIILSTIIDFSVGLVVAKEKNIKMKKKYLCLSICSNLGILAYFKYANFFIDNIYKSLHQIFPNLVIPQLDVILPIGISFYTFQTMSYTIDVFKDRRKPCRSLLDFSLYVSFFPQLIAGPIVRSEEFLEQMQNKIKFRLDYVGVGLTIFLFGLIKKIISDYLATSHIDIVFNGVDKFSAVDIWFAVYGYALQIYMDFSGYSDMAIGAALCLGFYLPKNFNYPYRAKSISEFWQRWHITLSSWLRDYLYIPLGGKQKPQWKTVRNLILTMLLGGLWHGAAWTFVFWGFFHGLCLVFFHTWVRISPFKIPKYLSILLTFHVVCIGWVFFRSTSMSSAWLLIQMLLDPSKYNEPVLIHYSIVNFILFLYFLHFVFDKSLLLKKVNLFYNEDYHKRTIFKYVLHFGGILAFIVLLSLFTRNLHTPFIYFQF
ncbi:MAG: MBOAT family protein [Oligoflexales bacterium]